MNNDPRTPPYRIETEAGNPICEGYESYGHACASASKYVIDAASTGAKDLDGSPIKALLVKDATDKVLRRVTENYPAEIIETLRLLGR